MALQQHLLDARCESKVTLEREGAVSETGFAAFGLVTVGVEGVFRQKHSAKVLRACAAPLPSNARAFILASQLYE